MLLCTRIILPSIVLTSPYRYIAGMSTSTTLVLPWLALRFVHSTFLGCYIIFHLDSGSCFTTSSLFSMQFSWYKQAFNCPPRSHHLRCNLFWIFSSQSEVSNYVAKHHSTMLIEVPNTLIGVTVPPDLHCPVSTWQKYVSGIIIIMHNITNICARWKKLNVLSGKWLVETSGGSCWMGILAHRHTGIYLVCAPTLIVTTGRTFNTPEWVSTRISRHEESKTLGRSQDRSRLVTDFRSCMWGQLRYTGNLYVLVSRMLVPRECCRRLLSFKYLVFSLI